jgi:hypothetical protein
MLISDKQQEANRRNAQHSSGPRTPEGKAAVRLNALKYGLRARDLIVFDEDPEEYKQLWAALEAECQPQTHTERLYLEQMSTSQWLLARMAATESYFFQIDLPPQIKLDLLKRVDRRRTRLERSFNTAVHELRQSQKDRRQSQARPQTLVQAKPTKPSAPDPCLRNTTDTRLLSLYHPPSITHLSQPPQHYPLPITYNPPPPLIFQ